jgi:hypothetical protein
MRGRGRAVLVVVVATATTAVPFALHAQNRTALRAAHRLLERLKLVDGAGSGLDADTVRGVSPLVVRDANGVVVGPVINADDIPLTVARRIDGRAMKIEVAAPGFIDTTCPEFCYDTADCTGTPYREASDAMLPFVSVCGGTAYYPTGTPTIRSMLACQITGGACVAQPGPTDMTVTTVATFEIATLGLVPPFQVDGP